MEQFDVETELAEIAALDRQVEMKKVKALARIADENFLPPPRRTPQQSERDKTNVNDATVNFIVDFPPATRSDGVLEYWSIGSGNPSLHHSITPTLHFFYSA